MKIAELFIAIGVSGANKTKTELADTRKGLGETASSALWAKAAIVGVLYGLERLVSGSNATGAAMQSMAGYTGLSAETLQRYAWAGRQANASAEEVQGSIMGIQKAMASLETTGQGPSGLWVIARELKGFDKTRARDAFYMFDKLQEFAKTTKLPTAIANQALESFGLSAGTISAMRRNAFDPKQLARANIFSNGQVGALARMNAQWATLGDNIQKAIGKMNVAHGGQMIKDITMITSQVLKLTDSLLTLADKLQVFKLVSKAFEGWGIILDSINQKVAEASGTKPKEEEGFLHKMLFNTEGLAKDFHDGKDTGFGDFKQNMKNWSYLLDEKLGKEGVIQPTTVQQTQNFYGKADPAQVGKAAQDGAQKAVSDAVWQSNKTRKN